MSRATAILGRLRSFAGRSTPAGGLFLSRVYAQLAQFAFFIVVARFIGVEDFGLFSLIFAVALGLSLLAEGGWREYLICHDEDALISRAYGLAIITALGICAAILALAAAARVVWPDANAALAPTIAAFAAWVPLRSLCTLESGRLTKAGRLHTISVAAVVSETAGFVAGLVALWAGLGILALGVSKLALQAAALLCLALPQRRVRCEWRRQPTDRAMIHFARQILIGRFAAYFSGNFSVFVIGIGLSTTAIGLFRAATRIAGAAAEALREPARVVVWSALKQSDGADLRLARARRAEDSAWYLLCVAAPVFVLLAMLSEPLIGLLLGAEWLPAAPIMAILAISYLIGFVTTLNEPVFALDNQPERARRLALTGAVLSGVAVLAAVPFGLHAVAWAQLAASAAVAVISLTSLRLHGGFASLRLLRRLMAPAFALAAMVGALWLCETRDLFAMLPGLIQLAMLGVAGLAVYAAVMGGLLLRSVRTGAAA